MKPTTTERSDFGNETAAERDYHREEAIMEMRQQWKETTVSLVKAKGTEMDGRKMRRRISM